MKISKLFHWLYCILILLPFFGAVGIGLVWVFNTGSEVPTVPEYVDREIDFNQLVYNGDFAYEGYEWELYNAHASYPSTGGVHIVCNVISDPYSEKSFSTYRSGGGYYENGHIYVLRFTYFGSSDVTNMYFRTNATSSISIPVASLSFGEVYSYLFTSQDNYTFNIEIGARGTTVPTSQITFDNIQIFDLTRMFGEGEEPTLEKFNQFFTNDYYNYVFHEPMILYDYDVVYVPDNWTNYIWLPSFGGMGATIKSVFTYLIQTMFGISVATGTGGYIVLELLTYWLCISLIWLCFDVIMYVPLLIHRMLDKGVIS